MLGNILFSYEACETKTKFIEGAGYDMTMWRPAIRNPNTNVFEPYSGNWGTYTPIDFMGVFALWILVELTWRFSKYVEKIAKDITGGATNLFMKGKDVASFVRSLRPRSS
jgi:hypothetical protein